jgi:hypothetical protein
MVANFVRRAREPFSRRNVIDGAGGESRDEIFTILRRRLPAAAHPSLAAPMFHWVARASPPAARLRFADLVAAT